MQSCPLGSPEEFQARLAEVKAMFEGRDVPRPEEWVGFRVVPRVFEFWYGASWLHERWRYRGGCCWLLA